MTDPVPGTPGPTTPTSTPPPGGTPAAEAEDPGPAEPSAAALAARRALAFAGHVPFTIALIVVSLVVSIGMGVLVTGAQGAAWYPEVAYGLPAFEAGRWLTVVFGVFFAPNLLAYAAMLGTFAVAVGFSEWRLGTLRLLVLAIGFHVASVLVTAGLLAVLRSTDWAWAQQAAAEVDTGFSGATMGVLVVAAATLPSPWQLRLKLVAVAYVLLAISLLGALADAEHLVSVLIALPLATVLAGPRAVRVTAPPSRREWRLIAAVGLVAVIVSQIIVHVVPDRLTPFGPAEHEPWTLALVVGSIIVWALIVRGLLRGRSWAWWIAVLVAAVPTVVAGAVLVADLAGSTMIADLAGPAAVAQLFAGATVHLVFLVVLLAARPAYRRPAGVERLDRCGEDPDTARGLLQVWGGSSVSWMLTWPRMRHMVTADGRGLVGFRDHAGVAIALTDPVGPQGYTEDILDEFVRRAEVADRVPFLFSCTHVAADAARARGWRVVQIAEDCLIDLPDLAFTGKKWQNVRTALNKAPKEGITFRLGALADQPPEILDQVKRVSEEWLGEKKLPEMGFTLGGIPEALDRDVRVGLAVDQQGRVHGVTSWLPAYRPGGTVRGWTLDVMRRIEFEGSFRPTMEFLIASSALAFKEQGADYLSLSGAPLARTGANPATDGPMEQLLDLIGATMEPVYGFRSLHEFKAKFQPRLDPMYMAYRDEADLPRIGIAITRAFMPDAGVGDMVAIAKETLGGLGGG